MKARVFALAFFAILFLSAAGAAEYHIKKDGTGNYTTIQACANAAFAGDTCWIHAGTYNEIIKPTHSGNANGYITFAAYGDGNVIVTSSSVTQWQGLFNIYGGINYIKIIGINFANSSYWGINININSSGVGSSNIILDNVKVYGSVDSGVFSDRVSYVTIANSEFYNNGDVGFWFYTADSLEAHRSKHIHVSNSKFHHNGSAGGNVDGLQLGDVDYALVENSEFYNNYDGLDIGSLDNDYGGKYIIIRNSTSHDNSNTNFPASSILYGPITFENSISYNNWDWGSTVHYDRSKNIHVWNSVFDDVQHGITDTDCCNQAGGDLSGPMYYYNNIIKASGNALNNTANATINNNYNRIQGGLVNVQLGPNSTTGSANFVNEASHDYHLTSNNPDLIDKGTFFMFTTGSGSNTNTINVNKDPQTYFAVGDTIQIQTIGTVKISSMTTTSITIQGTPISYTSGLGVHLPWIGSAPDIGAYEFQSGGPTCTDADLDGYGTSGSTGCTYSGTDCNDSDASIHPNATEKCGDGKDNDCSGGDAACSSCSQGAIPSTGCKCGTTNYYSGYCCNGSYQTSSCSTTYQYIWSEAESGTLTSPMAKGNDSNASGGQYVYSGTAEQGTAKYSLNIPVAGDYVVWGRAIASSGASNSFYSSTESHAEDIWDVLQWGPKHGAWSSEWRWDQISARGNGTADYPQYDPRIFNFTAGTHTLTIRAREANTRLDKLLTTNDLNFVPSGLGGGCTDADGDTYGTGCTPGNDCNDSNSSIHPGATEVCNAVDDDCDGTIDEGCAPTCTDADGDGYGTSGSTGCPHTGTDCNDADASIHPNATETCNSVDDDCDGSIDEGFDADGDGYKTCTGDCDDNNPNIHSLIPCTYDGTSCGQYQLCVLNCPQPPTENCTNAVDDDCDGSADCGDTDCSANPACETCPTGQLKCNEICITPACSSNAECDDQNALTIDTCNSPGTCSASCSNTPCPIRCNTNKECDDMNPKTKDTCYNPGTCSSYCTNKKPGKTPGSALQEETNIEGEITTETTLPTEEPISLEDLFSVEVLAVAVILVAVGAIAILWVLKRK